MSKPERSAPNFLRRWSQRKRVSQGHPDDRATSLEDEPHGAKANKDPRSVSATECTPPAFDPATLPPIESITATSDVRAFFAPGVPAELTRAALRRVWVTDPSIRNFVGIAENQWDFTAPDGVPGFGSLPFTPELRKMVAALIGDAPTVPQPELVDKPEAGHLLQPVSSAVDGSAKGGVLGFSGHVPAGDSPAGMPIPDPTDSADHVATEENGAKALNADRPRGGAVPK
jgi:Protein of unknown function (DUF3306)